jgi:hypothetical protein
MERASTPPPTDPDDDALVADLRRLLAIVDPVPEPARIAARVAIEWRTLESELAALVHDSTVDEPVLAVRGDAGPRSLTFEAPELTIEIETETEHTDAGESLRLVGQLIPPQTAQIAVRNGGGLVVTSADDRGRFDASGLSPGELSLRCRLADARLVETASLTI